MTKTISNHNKNTKKMSNNSKRELFHKLEDMITHSLAHLMIKIAETDLFFFDHTYSILMFFI